MLDTMDLRILRVLQKEPTLTISELGERVALSHTPCWRRIKAMESSKVITGRAILLDANLFGFSVSVFAFVKLKCHDESSLVNFETGIGQLSYVLQCYSVTGEFDYLLRILAKSIGDYEKILKQELLHLPSVAFINTSIALSEVKNSVDIPI